MRTQNIGTAQQDADSADTLLFDPRLRDDFAAIYKASCGLLLYVAGQLGVHGEEREDVAQQAYLRLLETGSSYTLAHAKSYLVCAVRSVVIDRSRRQKTRKTDTQEDWSGIEGRQLWMSDKAHDVALAALGRALDAFATQPATEMLAWFYRDGLSVQDIRARTGEPTGTVTAKLCRLRQKLAQQMRDEVEAALGGLVF